MNLKGLLVLHYVHVRALYDRNQCFVEFYRLLVSDFDRFVIVPVDELKISLELVDVSVSEPLPHLRQLGSHRPLLVPIQLLYLNVALITQEIDYVVDCLVVCGLDIAPIGFRQHLRVNLDHEMIVYPVFTKRLGYEHLLLILSFLLLKGGLPHPFCLSLGNHILLS